MEEELRQTGTADMPVRCWLGDLRVAESPILKT
jgi:hypothetical protein